MTSKTRKESRDGTRRRSGICGRAGEVKDEGAEGGKDDVFD